MVSRWRRRTAVEMRSAISAVSLPPCSMRCSVSRRICLRASLFFGGAFAVPLRGAGVDVPAVVVDALAFAGEVGEKCAEVGRRFLFKMQKADDDVSDLDAGVVNVVLHVDFVAGGAEQADECVAENRIAQMADVRGLVGIDGRCAQRARGPARTGDGCRRERLIERRRRGRDMR